MGWEYQIKPLLLPSRFCEGCTGLFHSHEGPEIKFSQLRRLFKYWEDLIKPFLLPRKSCSGRKSPVEVVQTCFSAVQVLKFSFHNCTGGVIPVDTCLSAGNIRESRIHCR